MLLELDRLSTEAEADRVAQVVNVHGHKLLNNLCVIEPTRFRVRATAAVINLKVHWSEVITPALSACE